MTSADLTALFRASASYEREISFLRDELAKEKARVSKMRELALEAGERLVRSRLTVVGGRMQFNPRLVLDAARKCTDIVIVAEVEVASHLEPIDLAKMTEALTIGGDVA